MEEEEGAVLQKRGGLAGGAVCCRHEEALTLLCSEGAGLQMASRFRFLVVQKAVEEGGDLNTHTQIIKQTQRDKTHEQEICSKIHTEIRYQFAWVDSDPKGAVSQREAEEVGLASQA